MPYSSRDAITMLISAPLTSANSAIAENTFVLIASGPSCTTSSSGPSDPASVSVGTAIDATTVTSRYAAPAIARPRNSVRGNTCGAAFVSSDTLTESSNPISA